MKNKCEICNSDDGLTEVFYCACDENSPSATLCKICRDKYFENNFVFGFRYYPDFTFAENLVEKYKFSHGITEKQKKEEPTMQVSYNGVTGELVKLEKKSTDYHIPPGAYITEYSLSIYDSEKRATTTFEGVKLEDVKFIGGAVQFS